MKKINELLVENKKLTVDEELFVSVHKSILRYGNEACQNMLSMSRELKMMHENKLFEVAGFNSFDEYVEDALGLKKSQAYNYIKIYNSYSEEFLLKNQNLGITKLLALTKLEDEEVVKRVVETVPVEDKKVSELNAIIESMSKEKKDLEKKSKDDIKILKDEVKKLKADLKAEKEKSKEPVVETEEEQEDIPNEEIEKLNSTISEKELKIKQLEAELIEVKKSSKTDLINSDPLLVEFKLFYNDTVKNINRMKVILNEINEDKKKGCINAIEYVRGLLNV